MPADFGCNWWILFPYFVGREIAVHMDIFYLVNSILCTGNGMDIGEKEKCITGIKGILYIAISCYTENV